MTLRHTSIRMRMLLLVSVPLLALIAVYAYAVVGQFGTAVGLANAGKVSGTTITPVSEALVALNAERGGATLYLATRSGQAAAGYRRDQSVTDRAFNLLETITSSGPVTANATALEKAAAAKFIKDDHGALQALRGEVAGATIGRTAAINAYSAVMSDGLRVGEQAIQVSYVSQSLATTARQEVNLYAADMIAAQESDIYSGDALSRQLPAADQKEFAQLVAVRRYLVQDAVPQLDPEASGLLRKEVPASLNAALTSEENAIIAAPAGRTTPPVALTTWQGTANTYAGNLQKVLTTSPAWIQAQVTSSARGALTTFIVAASIGLLAVIASIVFSFLMGRRLLRRLNGLRQSALELARERLPNVMTRLRNGDAVDLDAESPPAEAGIGAAAGSGARSDEIDQVQEAFNTVHRAAIEAAVDEAKLRRGVNDIFRNLARRNQALLHRQLGLLDGMERRAEEPEQLEDLFRIDHLTTRMRRHAEGLIVLSGDSSGRGWSRPVQFIDVLRAAVAEVEDYTRIRVEVRSRTALAGPAVADVVHLLAELIENAASFSPPSTVVRVQGELVGQGFAIEIEDRGLGIAEDRLQQINRDLAGLPAFDLAATDRLGLFITGRLAHRHGVKVTLRASAWGGTSAIVIIPTGLIVADDGQVAPHAAAGASLPPAAAAAALSSGNGHAGNGHPGNGHPGNGHPRNGHDPRAPRHAAVLQQDTQPFKFDAAAGASAESDWWGRPAPASSQAADSVQAGQAIAGATELAPDAGDHASPEAPGGRRDDDLPVRVPQAGLAPQLRDRDPAGSGALQAPPVSAEAVRSTMSAMQSGWERARSGAAAQPDEAAQGEEE
ncbi:MAG TPA: nitrate- and nitrite sensing domain-containing protein [Streptosporangiaceae bacterium]|nr:nitrate- and nitrite sensing domain-containing protein [Streptosporangiaceae bacterium]